MKNLKFLLLLFFPGFVGILSMLPVMASLPALQGENMPAPLWLLLTASAFQSSVLLALMIWLGNTFSTRVGLASPLLQAVAGSERLSGRIRPQLAPALAGGFAGGVFLLVFSGLASPYLPAGFLAAAEGFAPPWYTRILYGGITEEILVRWRRKSRRSWLPTLLSAMRPLVWWRAIYIGSTVWNAPLLRIWWRTSP